MSNKRAPHFAHAPSSNCSYGCATDVHLLVEQLIEAVRSRCLGIASALESEHAVRCGPPLTAMFAKFSTGSENLNEEVNE